MTGSVVRIAATWIVTGALLAFAAPGATATPAITYDSGTDTTDPGASASAGCEAGTKLAGGGGSITFPQAIIHAPFLNSSGPFGGEFLTYGYYSGAETVTSHASCLRKSLGKPKIEEASATLTANESDAADVECPAGTKVTGGGGIVSGPIEDAVLLSSRPTDDGDENLKNDDGWTVFARSNSETDLTIDAAVFCLDEGASALRYKKRGFDDTPEATAYCPPGSRVLSGGFAGNVNSSLVGTEPSFTNHAWTIRIDNDDSDLYGGTVYAICFKT